ncbi:MAG: sugar phosphorylase [Spirochaetae bacterium HGW-Spirochaetae-7]|nr:MAG: sugar phosphorylase [Spirochaetae bacterium HGW-Spirochaetae-7]
MDTVSLKGTPGGKAAELLAFIYGDRAGEASSLVEAVLARRLPGLERSGRLRAGRTGARAFTEKDALLISYGDMVAPLAAAGNGQSSLARLGDFIDRRMAGLFTYLHLLPFFPYSSDDGFSVMDYREVDPALGTWGDIEALGKTRSLAFDLVCNHASVQGTWFTSFKAGRKPFDRFFITRPLDYDASSVLRPRTHPLITPVELDDGRTVGVWTTFSADQADLDFSEPAVFAEFLDIVLGYAERGAGLLRLDAIAYLWKEDGTSCAHLPRTHAIVKLLRALIDSVGLDMVLLTETNVPHEENMSYFGSGDEAAMVYNFSLPPLVLHAFATGDAKPLSDWAAALRVPAGLLNFLASHDGIGVTPARGLIADFDRTIEAVKQRGGLVSYKAAPTGPAPYELNISWADAVSRPEADDDERSRALIASYAVACAMDGVPALYFPSIAGSRSWCDGPARLGYNRAINRERPRLDELEASLADPASMRSRSLAGLSSLLRERARRPSFAPAAARVAHPASGPVFIVERGTGNDAVLVLINCSPFQAAATIPAAWERTARAFDPVNGRAVQLPPSHGFVTLGAYDVRWLERRK